MTQHNASADKAYRHLKAALLDGSLARRDRLEIAEQARLFEMSVTPVREAAMRLVGEGLIETSLEGGLRAVQLTETRVRELLTVNHRLCVLALTWISPRRPTPLRLDAGDLADIEAAARRLFGEIARSTGNAVLVGFVAQVSDGLAPIRRAEPLVLPDPGRDLAELAARLGEAGHARTHAIGRYHRRRLDRATSLSWAARRAPDA